MRKRYNEPDVRIEYFALEDVVTASAGDIGGDDSGAIGAGGAYETPERPIG